MPSSPFDCVIDSSHAAVVYAPRGQFYSIPIDSTTWTLRDDDRYDIPNWSEKCGRASIPKLQNTGAMAPFGRTGGFVRYNRMLEGDPFWVATPGFDHCTATDTTCVMQKNTT